MAIPTDQPSQGQTGPGHGPDEDVLVLPASFAQQRLWFLDQLVPNSYAYNVPLAVRLRGRLDVPALAGSLTELVRRHESLRTTFVAPGAEPLQVVAAPREAGLPQRDLAGLPGPDRLRRLQELLDGAAQRPFDLAAGPLLRTLLIRLGESEHVLSVVFHHIIVDGWSTGVFFDELAAGYGAFRRGEPSPLPELPIQYADFSQWQREPEQVVVQERQLDYWRTQLTGVPHILELPTDRPRPWARDVAGATYLCELPARLADAVERLGQTEQASEFIVLMATVQALLSRYSGQTDICVGTPVAGRVRLELEPLIGFFANTLVVRGDLSGTPTFRELLRQIRETSLAAYENQDVPFERVVDELRPERSISHSPLFQVMFVMQNAPGEDGATLPGVELEVIEPRLKIAKFDLTIMAWRTAGGLGMSYEYSTDLFDAATIHRLADNFQVLLEAVVTDPDRRACDLPLLHTGERHRLLVEWNATGTCSGGATGSDQTGSLPAVFEEQVDRYPTTTAVEVGDAVLTYHELDHRASQLAHWLIGHGVGPERLVALAVPRSAAQVVALVAVLKAGGGYLPLDLDHPGERIATVLRDAGPVVVLTTSAAGAVVPEVPGAVRLVLDQPATAAELASCPARRPTDADRLAPLLPASPVYALYTSGSTGVPKGVLMPAGAITNLLAWQAGEIPAGPGRRVAQFTSICFDVSAQEILSALLSGKSLVVPDDETRRDPVAFAYWLDRQRISELYAPNLVIEALCRAAAQEGVDLAELTDVVQAGEALVVSEQVARFFEKRPDCRLHNHYGPSETHVVTGHVLPPDPSGWPVHPPIGGPISNTTVRVLDRRLGLAPQGARGELFLAGDCLARGYLGRPGLTAQRFLPDPFGRPGSRMYRSGDLARWRNDGNLEFLTRADHQVKIRGYRIELGEVEAGLVRHPGVREAAVVVHEGSEGDQRLVAYLVPATGPPPTGAELRTYLGDVLPAYMVPAGYVVLDALPLTRNGKLDRAALPEPELERTVGGAVVAPRDPGERLIADIWAEVLGLDRVGVHDNFFELGGHSLLATQVLARIRRATGKHVPLWTIFQSPTVATLAEQVASVRPGEPSTSVTGAPIARQPRPETGPAEFPAAFSQRRLWFIEQMIPGTSSYHVPAVDRLRGPLAVAALERSFQEILRRHEVLRTTFKEVDGELRQVVRPPARFRLSPEDVPGSGAEQWERARRLVDQETVRPFDLVRGPVFRARLLRLADHDHLLVMTVHHIAFDGWSAATLFSELTTLYEGYRHGQPAGLPELPVQFADYSVWQLQSQQQDGYGRQLAYWKERLAGAPGTLELPGDRPRPAVRTMRGSTHEQLLPKATWEAVERLAGAEQTTPFVVLLAAYQALLSRYTGQSDLCVGSPVAGRPRPELEPLIGFFINTLVLRGDLSGDPSFTELVRRTRGHCLAAFECQDVPFEQLVEELRPKRDPGTTPLFQVMFALQNAPGGGAGGLPGLVTEPVPTSVVTAKFDLVLHVWSTGQGMATVFEYSTDLFDPTTIERMAQHLRCLLAAALADPGRRLAELPLLDDAEHQLVTRDWNPRAVLPADRCLPELVAEHAARTPEAVAVRYGDARLTYRELHERANQLAHHLVSLGVGPETPVGICLDRSTELVVAVLAVLTAGGGYVPLNPEYPSQWLRFVLADASAPVVIARSATADRVSGQRARLVDLEAEAGLISARPVAAPPVTVAPHHLAYVIYTSGSSGRPKGVAVSQAAVLRLLASTGPDLGSGRGDVWTMFHSYAFDFSVWEMWGALAYGGTLVVVPVEVTRSPAAFADLLVRERVTVLNLTPSALRELTGALFGPGGEQVVDRLALRCVILGGEALAVGELRDWFDRLGDRCPRMVNMYGITETTVHTTIRSIHAGDLAGPRSPIGRALADVATYVLDGSMNPMPVGVPGELYVGGAGVARGYLNRPGLTAQRFVPDPFPGAGGGSRLYRTGDRCRWLASGELEYLGRVDGQVKLRGYRIELGEIESTLDRHPLVRACAVLLREDAPGDRRLVAYVEPAGDAGVPAGALRAYLAQRLPGHMVPASYVPVPAWPLTVNGKLDRAALPAPGTDRPDAGEFAAPRPGTEQAVADLWSRLLRVDLVGRHDDFFALGGHSFVALTMVSRLEQELGHRLPAAAVFQAPTVELLARVMDDGVPPSQGSPLVTLRAGGDGRAVVLVHPIGGNVLCYADLARGLATGHPIHGLVAAGLDGRDQPSRSIEEMADRYVDAVLSAGLPDRATGYALAGWSMGGSVAYQMARRLHARTGEHPPLVLIDSYPPEPADGTDRGDAELLAWFADDWGRGAGADLGVSAEQLARLPEHRRLEHVWRRAIEAGVSSPDDALPVVQNLGSVFRAHAGALARYLPPKDYRGDLLVLAASVGHQGVTDPRRGWQEWTSGTVVGRVVPGDHYDLLRGDGPPRVATEIMDWLRSSDA